MAERKITTIHLLKSYALYGSAGTTKDSDPIDLRDISAKGNFSLSYTVGTSGGIATCGSCNFLYLGCDVYDGTYVIPTGGTCATIGDSGGSDIISISPPVVPFIKIRASVGTSGTALVTAALNVR